MNNCIKTGARVYFPDWSKMFSADIYSVGDCWIIRASPNMLDSGPDPDIDPNDPRIDLVVYGVQPTHVQWFRDDLGVFVCQHIFCSVSPSFVTHMERNAVYDPHTQLPVWCRKVVAD